MNFSQDKNQEFVSKKQEIKAEEAEIRLRELELEINQQDNQNNTNFPHYQTRKHQEPASYLKKLTKKLIKVGKFLSFTILTIALMRVGFLVGMWLTYAFITTVIIVIGYQLFLGNTDD